MTSSTTKSKLVFSGFALAALLALSVSGCGGGSSVTSALGIGDSSVTVNGIAYYVVNSSSTPIEGAAVTFTPLTGNAVTGSTTGTDGSFTLTGVPGGAEGEFTFTTNTTAFTSSTVTIPTNGGSVGSVNCTQYTSTLVKK